jgi:antitoxin (DNA-binding transcriptional repressor) of toxin-antitoxin stability system
MKLLVATLVCMRYVGLKVLKNRLSEYVRLAASGETVLVTDRDRVVAELVPPQPGRIRRSTDAWWEEQVRCGHITPAKRLPGAALPRKPVMSFRELMTDLEQDREDR